VGWVHKSIAALSGASACAYCLESLVKFGARDPHLLSAEFTIDFHEGAKKRGFLSQEVYGL
jgi:hypothetical protein